MLIVDAQARMQGPSTARRPWPDRGPPQREVTLELDEPLREMDQRTRCLRMAGAGREAPINVIIFHQYLFIKKHLQ